MRAGFLSAWTCAVVLAACAASARQEAGEPRVGRDPRAAEILRAMSECLHRARAFTFTARIEYETAGHPKLQYGAVQSASVRRPDRLRVEYRGDLIDRLAWFDGKQLTYLDPEVNLYAQMSTGPRLDAALDKLLDDAGFNFPLSDFFYDDAYASLAAETTESAYLGLHAVDGVECHHLYFGGETAGFQVWIEAGERPLPHKLVITYTQLEQAPQFSATFLRWDLATPLADTHFRCELPEGARRIGFVASGELEK
jgi:hypothetical protein